MTHVDDMTHVEVARKLQKMKAIFDDKSATIPERETALRKARELAQANPQFTFSDELTEWLHPNSWVERRGIEDGIEWVTAGLAMGHRCGYVRVPESHPWAGRGYSDPAWSESGWPGVKAAIRRWIKREPVKADWENQIASVVRVHGGLTYDGELPIDMSDEPGHWLGFDCAHAWDLRDPSLMSARYRDLHEKYGDVDYGDSHIRDANYVQRETEYLARQIAAVGRGESPENVLPEQRLIQAAKTKGK